MGMLRKTAIPPIRPGRVAEIGKKQAALDGANHDQSQVLNSQLTAQRVYFETYIMGMLRKTAIVTVHIAEVRFSTRLR
jgi:hypothetical protein